VPLRVLFSASVPKVFEFPGDNEDSVAVAPNGLRIAVSDGASDSFDSRRWSRMLASVFVEDATADAVWISRTVAHYETVMQPLLETVRSPAVQAAVERGSFASLLGLERLADNRGVRAYAIGDSVAVLLSGSNNENVTRIDSFPYRKSREFRQRPELVSTNRRLNRFANAPEFPASHERYWLQGKRDALEILCMTDALAEWAFRQEEDGLSVWRELLQMRSESEFVRLVASARESRQMRVDDSTLVVVSCPFCYDFTEF
jgi:hypothetical protein